MSVFILSALILGYSRHKHINLSFKEISKVTLTPLGVMVSSWPIFKYGYSWISYVNDDMNNYVLAAMRFYENGFFQQPDSRFLAGTDYTQTYYYFHVTQGVRPGSELYLSAYSIFTQGQAISIFMSAIISLQMVLLFSTLALSRTIFGSSRNSLRLTYILFLILPLVSLGFLYQLIGQVGGLAIAFTIISLSAFIFKQKQFNQWKALILILGVLLAAQFIWYPEMLPFLGLPILIKIMLLNKEQRRDLRKYSLGVVLLAVILLNKYFVDAVRFSVFQILGAQETADGTESISQLFPYFLKPHGISSLIGFSPLNKWEIEPLESLFVIISVVTLVILLMGIIQGKMYRELAGIMFLIMFITFIYLIYSGNGFGSFKLAMFIQPLLVVILAQLLLQHLPRITGSKIKIISTTLALAIFVLSTARTNQFYVSASTGNTTKGFSEVPGGSSVGFTSMVESSLEDYKPSDGIVSSASVNLSQVKLEAIAAKGVPLVFPVIDVFSNFFDSSSAEKANVGRTKIEIFEGKYANEFSQLHGPHKLVNDVKTFLIGSNKNDILNRSRVGASPSWTYRIERNPQNLLLFINSKKGPIYYASGIRREEAVLFQPEGNPLVAGGFMQSIGNTLLFEIVNPSPNPYLIMEATASVLSQNNRVLSKISISGESNANLPMTGKGSTRILYPLVEPLTINGKHYFQLNLKGNASPFPNSGGGASNFFGSDILVDSRKIALFATNISVIDKSEIGKAPSFIANFPADLANQNLSYSGIYEDGWISKRSYFYLSSDDRQNFYIKGTIPDLKQKFPTVMSIKIDGKTVAKRELQKGYFELRLPSTYWAEKDLPQKIEIAFDREMKLPGLDGRPVSAFISYLGF